MSCPHNQVCRCTQIIPAHEGWYYRYKKDDGSLEETVYAVPCWGLLEMVGIPPDDFCQCVRPVTEWGCTLDWPDESEAEVWWSPTVPRGLSEPKKEKS